MTQCRLLLSDDARLRDGKAFCVPSSHGFSSRTDSPVRFPDVVDRACLTIKRSAACVSSPTALIDFRSRMACFASEWGPRNHIMGRARENVRVAETGLEPVREVELSRDFKSRASANSATRPMLEENSRNAARNVWRASWGLPTHLVRYSVATKFDDPSVSEALNVKVDGPICQPR